MFWWRVGGCGTLGEYKWPASRKSSCRQKGFQKFLWAFNIFFFSSVLFSGTMLYRCWKPSDRLLWIQTDYSCWPLPASCTLPRVASQACWGSMFDTKSIRPFRERKHVRPFAEAHHITHNNMIINITWSVMLAAGYTRRLKWFCFPCSMQCLARSCFSSVSWTVW